MNSRFIGGILLIVGTSIGGGMLALPVANAATGFWQSSLFLLLCWAVMTLGALFILEANLYLPPGKHMVSMAEATLGIPGLLVAWLSYLFLLYSLLAGYISGGADVFSSLLGFVNIHLQEWQAILLFTLIFGMVVYGGIRKVDLLNRLLMFGKLGAYCLLVLLISPKVKAEHLISGDYRYIAGTIMILITSFGYAIIIPNLRDYFNDDLRTLRKVILIGSCIPLFCYLAWDAIIMGTLPTEGDTGLAALLHDEHTTSALAGILSQTVNNPLISSIFNFFTSICMLTAFLGVSLCLISFLADGFKMEQQGRAGVLLFILTFLPPLLLVIYSPGIYIKALNYAGIFCVILLLLLPALMTVYGRKRFKGRYTVPGGAYTQSIVIIFSIILMVNAIWQLLNQ
ncbi:tyrosine-specific transport protein [Legionella birminghamensis]|uniref:Tyrosine-specific transport protein n=1 Tax=Legionella birminghamensis TaxID=28083 RepID=A0A378IDR2_9GAMM|nr:aromatic amino acid transport family protein [Legionella birminghamensis]KTC71590.1 tyrosine-specific transport protein [Legionella birminghamensis]STX32875.1 tyrosine-specific transport protein [Legionella birminghamensis]